MSDLYDVVSDTLAEVIGKAKGQSTGYFYELDHLTVDQQLQALQVQALLVVAVEINHLRHAGIAPYDEDFDR